MCVWRVRALLATARGFSVCVCLSAALSVPVFLVFDFCVFRVVLFFIEFDF